jgi:hypothetical protein
MKVLDYWKEEVAGKQIKVLKIPHDINGNPRYFIPLSDINEKPEIALEKAKSIGGKKYKGKCYEAGVIIKSYSLQNDLKLMMEK